MRETYEQLEESRSRLAYTLDYTRRERNSLYNRLRALENAVRSTIVVGERVDPDALYRLRQRVPNKPLPTLRQRAKIKGRIR